MIWKAPWGKHIDISRILEVSGPASGYDSCGNRLFFEITYQLMDAPVMISFWRAATLRQMEEARERSEYNESGKEIKIGALEILNEWHWELLRTWREYKKNEQSNSI